MRRVAITGIGAISSLGRTAAEFAESLRQGRGGLDPALARELTAPLRAILEWRRAAVELKKDSTFTVRIPAQGTALIQVPFPRTNADGNPVIEPGAVADVGVWRVGWE